MMISKKDIGRMCTVDRHIGHESINEKMKIIAVRTSYRCYTGIAVIVDGLDWDVDASLINLIEIDPNEVLCEKVIVSFSAGSDGISFSINFRIVPC
jgi:hypothetical protein